MFFSLFVVVFVSKALCTPRGVIHTFPEPIFVEKHVRPSPRLLSVKSYEFQHFLVHFDTVEEFSSFKAVENVKIVGHVPENALLVFSTHSTIESLKNQYVAREKHFWYTKFLPENKFSSEPTAEVSGIKIWSSAVDLNNFIHKSQRELRDKRFEFSVNDFEIDSDNRISLLFGEQSLVKESLDLLRTYFTEQSDVYFFEFTSPITPHIKWARSVVLEGSDSIFSYQSSELLHWKHNLTGAGQIIGVGDTGLDVHSCFFANKHNIDDKDRGVYKKFVGHETAIRDNYYINSDDFKQRKVVQYVTFADDNDDNPDTFGHGTHMCGSIAGRPLPVDVSGGVISEKHMEFVGIAEDSKIALFDLGPPKGKYLYVPRNLETDYFPWAYAAGARLHLSSWGSRSNSYTAFSHDVDSFMYRHKDFLIILTAGSGGSCGEANTVTSPGTAKNAITLGSGLNTAAAWRTAFNKSGEYKSYGPEGFDENSIASFSSIGPTSDNRIKPDLIAPGYYIMSANNAATSSLDCSESALSDSLRFSAGTSIAASVTTAVLTIARQYFMEGYYPSGVATEKDRFVPSGALLKNIAINSGERMTGVKIVSDKNYGDRCGDKGTLKLGKRPDNVQGFGRVLLSNVLYFKDEPSPFLHIASGSADTLPGNFGDIELKKDQVHRYSYCQFPDRGGLEGVKITLVWVDPPPSPSTRKALVNDLNLIVTIGGRQYFGNMQSTVDHLNTVEAVYLKGLSGTASKDFMVEVNGVIVKNGAQTYSLVLTGNIGAGECSQVTQPGPGLTMSATDTMREVHQLVQPIYTEDPSKPPETSGEMISKGGVLKVTAGLIGGVLLFGGVGMIFIRVMKPSKKTSPRPKMKKKLKIPRVFKIGRFETLHEEGEDVGENAKEMKEVTE